MAEAWAERDEPTGTVRVFVPCDVDYTTVIGHLVQWFDDVTVTREPIGDTTFRWCITGTRRK